MLLSACAPSEPHTESPAEVSPSPAEVSSSEEAPSNASDVTQMLEQLQAVALTSDMKYQLPEEQEERLSTLVDTALSNYIAVIGAVILVPPDDQRKALDQGLPLVETETYRGAQMSLPIEEGMVPGPPCIEPTTEQDEAWASEFLAAATLETLDDPPRHAIELDRRLRRVKWEGKVFGCAESLDRHYVGVADGKLVLLTLPRS